MELTEIIKKVVLWAVGTVVYYSVAMSVLFIMTLVLGDTFENLWLSAIPVTGLAELLLLLVYLWKKWKVKRGKARDYSGY